MTERQELYCHGCGNYVQFDVDMALDGNHVFECPVCGHEHCRVVRNGQITGDRWDSRNSTFYVPTSSMTTSSTSTYISYTTGSSSTTTTSTTSDFLYSSWMNTVGAGMGSSGSSGPTM